MVKIIPKLQHLAKPWYILTHIETGAHETEWPFNPTTHLLTQPTTKVFFYLLKPENKG